MRRHRPHRALPMLLAASAAICMAQPSLARPTHQALANASQVFDYTDDSGTTHLTNLPAAPRSTPYEVLVEAEPEPAVGTQALAIPLPPSFAVRGWVEEAAQKEHVEAALIYAVMATESGFNPAAVSPKGAVGLMQLMPEVAERYGVSDRFDPRASVFAGAKHLRVLLEQFNHDAPLAIAAYNAGSAAVLKYHSAVPPFAETQAYVPRVLALYRRLLAAGLANP